MKPRKEHYRRKLPHFQQHGQWYSVTCILAGAMPKGAMQKYSMEVEMARNRLEQLRVVVSSGAEPSPGIGVSNSYKTFDLGKSQSPGVGLSKSDISDFSDLRKSKSQK